MSRDMNFESFDALLDAYLMSGDADDPSALASWVRRYPEYGQELTEFALRRTMLAALPEPADDPEEENAILSRGMEIVRGILYESREVLAPRAAPLTDLLAEANARGLDARGLARSLRLTLPLVSRLHRRLIRVGSIPVQLLEQLAELLGREMDSIVTYLQQPPVLQTGLNYKSETLPTAGEMEDFFAVLRADQRLAQEDRMYWEQYATEDQ